MTDYWYLEAISDLLEEGNKSGIEKTIALVPASSASKVVYFATILHAQNLKVYALLDSDASGDQAATQDSLVDFAQVIGPEFSKYKLAKAFLRWVLADEPTGSLDSKTGVETMDIFRRLNEQGRTIIVITHDRQVAEQAKRIVRFRDGS